MIFSPAQMNNQALPSGYSLPPRSPSIYSRNLLSPAGGAGAGSRPLDYGLGGGLASPANVVSRPGGISRQPSSSDFQVERTTPRLTARRSNSSSFDTPTEEMLVRGKVGELLAAKRRPFSVSGRIPVDVSNLVVFFRSKSGITHSLDFPIDPLYDTPPALDVLIASCRPHLSADDVDDFVDGESLFFPPNLPLTCTFDISNHPILEVIQSHLFPTLLPGSHLTTVQDKLEVLVSGGKMARQPRSLRDDNNDGRIATIIVVLPVRFRGGTLRVTDPQDPENLVETFSGRGGKPGDLEWVAFTAESDYEIETVNKGCRLSISYAVHVKSFGPSTPLVHPSDAFLDRISPILNMTRGRKIAFHLVHDYGINPAEVVAESLVPTLKGGDSLLYHALRLYKLTPELHYTAGGYIWPVDGTIDLIDESGELIKSTASLHIGGNAYPSPRGQGPSLVGGMGASSGLDPDAQLRVLVEQSGAVPLADAEIVVLSDPTIHGGTAGKERVVFQSNGQVEKLVVYVMIATFVP